MQKVRNAISAAGMLPAQNELHKRHSTMLYRAILLVVALCASVSAALATPVDITAFGAVGDGVTDNRIAIQNAIDSVSGTGGTVYFPAGYFNVSGTLSVPSNVRLQGLGSFFNCQIRLTVENKALFDVTDGKSNIIFKDLTLVGLSRNVWPRSSSDEVELLRRENTKGISFRAGTLGISNIVIENVRINQFTRGISATSDIAGYDASITNVKIRNYASDGNEYSLYTKTRGADNWDVQNMNVYPMYQDQNGIFLELSGEMRFLQLSCAGISAGVCAKLWGNGDTYFRNMHVEGPRLGFCVGTHCGGAETGSSGPNNSVLTVENSATDGEFHRATNLVSNNNRIWLDTDIPPRFKFFGAGSNSSVVSCGDVWVSGNPATHMTNTTVTPPADAFPGLETAVQGCLSDFISQVPIFNQGYTADNERLSGETNVTFFGAVPNDGIDDSMAFLNALSTANSSNTKRVFVPAGIYDVSMTLDLYGGETFLGEAGSVIRLNGNYASLFRIVATPAVVRGITWRNLVLRAGSAIGTTGISMENHSATAAGAASDFQIQNVDFEGFETGISVHPFGGVLSNANPMYDSVSVKDADFNLNKTAILIRSQNASHWNLENIRVNILHSKEGVRVDGIGHLSIRDLSCTSPGTGTACVTVQRQNGLSIQGLTASNVTYALSVPWENGWTQFPVTIRDSDLRAGVYFQGRIYLNSVNNFYPANLTSDTSPRIVRFGAYQEGDPNNIDFGELSDIFSCNDTFVDNATQQTQSTWAYTGALQPPVTYCY